MKKYDVIVIGSGCGLNIVDEALTHGKRVALVDKGPLGGTCPNLGCIPSKMLIYTADMVTEIQEVGKLGIEAEIKNVDFKSIMERMRKFVRGNQSQIKKNLKGEKNLGFFEGEGRFTGPETLEVNGEEIRGEKIFIASGSRPLIPPLPGLEKTDYLTNGTLLELEERPESLIIIGGGYIAVEYGHFLAAMGVRVTILEMADRLVLSEEPEIAARLQKELGRRTDIFTGVRAQEVKQDSRGFTVSVSDIKTGRARQFRAQRLLVAAGRRSNADTLRVEKAGVEVDARGYIKTNEYLETTQNNIWAVGDANGRQMFTHVANRESAVAAHNALHEGKMKMDYRAAPHAVYSHPQIAAVGLTEAEARKAVKKVLIGRAKYADVAAGEFMMEENGFAKAIVEGETGKILGFHIIGPYAPILIQEVINVMAGNGDVNHIQQGMHIHPSPPELVQAAIGNLAEE
jgi:mycothione reductase